MLRLPSRLTPVVLAASAGLALACGGDDSGPQAPSGSEPQLSSVDVSPDSARLSEIGATRNFDATARDADGDAISGVSFSWSVSDPSLATVDSTGTVTAKAPGTASVEAEADGITGSAGLAVEASGRVNAACTELSLGASSAVPLDTVELSGIPDTMQAPVSALVAAGADTGRVFVARSGGSGQMVAPPAPGGDPDGGEVSVHVTDGAVTCPARELTIEALPEAPGTVSSMVDSLERIVELQGRALGVDTEALAGASLDTLPKVAWPLALARNYIDGPDNPNSLRKIAEGSAPIVDGDTTAVDLTDRLVGREEILGVLSTQLDSIRSRLDTVGTTSSGVRAATAPDATRLECSPPRIQDPALLQTCMEVQYSSQFSLENNKTARGRLGKIVGAAGLLPGGQVPSAVVGSGLFLHAAVLEGSAKLLPSDFVEGDVTLEETTYLEDQAGPDQWHDAWVRAASDGWSMEQTLLKALLQAAGAAGAYDDYVNGFMKDSDVAQDVASFILNQLTNKAISGTDGSEIVDIPARTTGEVSIDAEQWSYQDISSAGEPAITFTDHRTYEPRRVGSATVFVGTARDKFPGANWTSDGRTVEVRRMRVAVEPRERNASPGETRQFEVIVRRAVDNDLVVRVTAGQKQIVSESDSSLTVDVTAPADETQFPVGVVAQDTSSSGAREYSDRPRYGQGVVYEEGSIEILPGGACVEHGQTRDFDAEVRGPDDPQVVWSATGGAVDQNGIFTAPDQNGRAAVEATSSADTTLTDVAAVAVRRDCDQWWSVSAGGRATSGDTTQATPEGGVVQASLGLRLDDVALQGMSSNDFLAVIGDGGGVTGFFPDGTILACGENQTVDVGGTEIPIPCFGEVVESSGSDVTARLSGTACLSSPTATDPCSEGIVPVEVWFSAPRIETASGSVDAELMRR